MDASREALIRTVVAPQATAASRIIASPINSRLVGSRSPSAKATATPAKAQSNPTAWITLIRSLGTNRWAPSATMKGEV